MQISDIKKVVVWGLSMHSHTSGYVHDAIYCAFKALKLNARIAVASIFFIKIILN